MQSERVIESDPDLLQQKGDRVVTWTKSRKAARLMLGRVQHRIGALPGRPVSDQIKSASLAASRRASRSGWRELPAQLYQWARANTENVPLVNRYALHLVIVLLAIGVVVVTQVRIPQLDLLLPISLPGPDLTQDTITTTVSSRGGTRVVENDMALYAAPVAHTIIPDRARTEVITYTVQANDNMWAISQKLGLQVETLLWANPDMEKNPDLLSVDQVLVVPPVDGVYYTVRRGDTLAKLAKKYKTSVDKILGFAPNGIDNSSQLVAGQKLMLPGGIKPVPVPAVPIYPMTRVGSAPKGAPKGSGRFAWPTQGLLSQRYWSGHTGIDIANRIGAPVLAADAGYVVLAGWDTWGYGNQIVIDHGNGFWTRYAHLSKVLVTAGDIVKKNQKIGLMGSTGRSTGPHLHFEVIYKSTQRNPMSYLP